MTDCVDEQARELYRTVRMLKARLGREFQARTRAQRAGDACGGLTLVQGNVLLAIHERENLSLKELARILHVSRPSASAMVDRLLEMDLVVREQSTLDRREVRIRLSERGAHHFNDMERQILEYITELLVKLGPLYSAQWCDVYGQIREILRAEIESETTQELIEDAVQ